MPVARAPLLRSTQGVDLRHDGLQGTPHVVGDNTLAREIRMDTILLVELGTSGDAVEQKRNQCHSFIPGDRRVRFPEASRVASAKIRRRLHDGEQDFRVRLSLAYPADDCREIRLERVRVERAQRVVAPCLQHNDVHRILERPVDAAERSEEHTSELQSPCNLVCRLLLEKKKLYMCIMTAA